MTLNNERQYRPATGSLVRLKEYQDYTSRNINVWAWFKVLDVNIDANSACLQHSNAGQLLEIITVPLARIAPPIGWEPRYEIFCKPEETNKVLEWFNRGIVVRANHCIGNSAGSTFQPADNAGVPHWKYPSVTDVISPEDCPKLFRVIEVIEEEITSQTIDFPPVSDCPMCKGIGRRTIAELANVRNETVEQLWSLIDAGSVTLEDLTRNATENSAETFRCTCHYGAFRRLGRSKRAKLIKEMKSNGWTVTYVPYAGGFWTRRKETVIHEWQ